MKNLSWYGEDTMEDDEQDHSWVLGLLVAGLVFAVTTTWSRVVMLWAVWFVKLVSVGALLVLVKAWEFMKHLFS